MDKGLISIFWKHWKLLPGQNNNGIILIISDTWTPCSNEFQQVEHPHLQTEDRWRTPPWSFYWKLDDGLAKRCCFEKLSWNEVDDDFFLFLSTRHNQTNRKLTIFHTLYRINLNFSKQRNLVRPSSLLRRKEDSQWSSSPMILVTPIAKIHLRMKFMLLKFWSDKRVILTLF